MRIVRCAHGDQEFYGTLAGEEIRRITGDPYGPMVESGQRYALGDVTLLPPCAPGKAVCVGLNYRGHAQEMAQALPETPLIFLKPSTALLSPGGTICYPRQTKNLHYEAELAVVIGRRATDISAAEALSYVLGYTCANDVTARDLQKQDGQWTRAKGFDTFLPLGPWVETDLDPSTLEVTLTCGGAVRQRGNTRDLIFPVPVLLSFISSVMTLLPGDVVLTGTPEGIGPMEPGDRVAVAIDGIGTLENTVGPREG